MTRLAWAVGSPAKLNGSGSAPYLQLAGFLSLASLSLILFPHLVVLFSRGRGEEATGKAGLGRFAETPHVNDFAQFLQQQGFIYLVPIFLILFPQAVQFP